ncbi:MULTISPECIES: hypothetical protein [Sphingomonas]|uniref:hypothetical protein n=1 Tax=Sphingomonas TaxID=13687 RepID=UPI000DEFE4CC|nr:MULTISPECIES: hypothetical protein [Sphingomonas]
MSLKSFKSVGWVAGIAATALGCYMVNLQVASERASLEETENRIVLAQRDIRLLQTEIGTRGRLAQLEQWNVKVLALSAPKANQFLEGSFQLATLAAPHKTMDPSAPVVLASAPAPKPSAPVVDDDGPVSNAAPVAAPAVAAAPKPASPSEMMHVASFRRDLGGSSTVAQKTVEKPAVRATAPATPAKTAASKVAESAARPKPKGLDPLAARPSTPKSKSKEAATDR